MRIIEVRTCGECPYQYKRGNEQKYGIEKDYRCSKLGGGKNYKPFDEVLNYQTYKFSIDSRCPLKLIKEDIFPTCCPDCTGEKIITDDNGELKKCDRCNGNGYVMVKEDTV